MTWNDILIDWNMKNNIDIIVFADNEGVHKAAPIGISPAGATVQKGDDTILVPCGDVIDAEVA